MQAGQKFGMQTMNQGLLQAVHDKALSPEARPRTQHGPPRAGVDAREGHEDGGLRRRDVMPTFVWKLVERLP